MCSGMVVCVCGRQLGEWKCNCVRLTCASLIGGMVRDQQVPVIIGRTVDLPAAANLESEWY